MNHWAGLVVDRHNLPCVGRPLDLYPEYAEVYLDDTPSVPQERQAVAPDGFLGKVAGRGPSLNAGDKVGSWLLMEYRKGGVDPSNPDRRYRPHWYCKCQCTEQCTNERWVRAEDLTARKSTSCTRGVKLGQRLNRNSAV